METLTKLTPEQISEALFNAGYGRPKVVSASFVGWSNAAAMYNVMFDPSETAWHGLVQHVYVTEYNDHYEADI